MTNYSDLAFPGTDDYLNDLAGVDEESEIHDYHFKTLNDLDYLVRDRPLLIKAIQTMGDMPLSYINQNIRKRNLLDKTFFDYAYDANRLAAMRRMDDVVNDAFVAQQQIDKLRDLTTFVQVEDSGLHPFQEVVGSRNELARAIDIHNRLGKIQKGKKMKMDRIKLTNRALQDGEDGDRLVSLFSKNKVIPPNAAEVIAEMAHKHPSRPPTAEELDPTAPIPSSGRDSFTGKTIEARTQYFPY